MVTCASHDYLRLRGEPRSLQDLAGHSLVTFLSGQNNRPLPWHFVVTGEDRPRKPHGAIAVNDSTAYVHCGLAGFGIIQAPGITLEAFLANGELVEVLAAFRPKPRPVSILYPSRAHLAPQVQAFAGWLKKNFQALHPRWFKAR